MSASAPPLPDRWTHLVNTATWLESRSPQTHAVVVVAALDSALEIFSAGVEPTDDFEGYAVRRFLLALRDGVKDRIP